MKKILREKANKLYWKKKIKHVPPSQKDPQVKSAREDMVEGNLGFLGWVCMRGK